MMKKLLALGMILSVTFLFVFTAAAQDTDPEVECPKCEKGCALPEIPCPQEDQQGGRDCQPVEIPWECFIFPVCNCPDTEENFLEGQQIGIRMHILTEGVYWADQQTTLNILAYESIGDACEEDIDRQFATFSDILYFEDEVCDPDDAVIPYTGLDCTWSTDDNPKASSLGTNRDNPAAFFTIPAGWEGYAYWTIEIPDIKIDVEEVLAAGLSGENVRVRIEIIKPGTGGICQGSCQVICECVIEIATLCTTTGIGVGGGCIYFPYVLTQLSPWATGIALSNLGTVTPDAMVAEFILTDMNGDVFTYLKDDFESANYSNIVDALLGDFDGTPAPGQAWLKVETNFPVDGYQFITDGIFGGSTLPRSCDFDSVNGD
jgi:hypothetical protein